MLCDTKAQYNTTLALHALLLSVYTLPAGVRVNCLSVGAVWTPTPVMRPEVGGAAFKFCTSVPEEQCSCVLLQKWSCQLMGCKKRTCNCIAKSQRGGGEEKCIVGSHLRKLRMNLLECGRRRRASCNAHFISPPPPYPPLMHATHACTHTA